MTFKSSFSAVLICLALCGASVAADAQQPAAPKRGAVKARPQFFNPFDVKKSRLKINRFGFFTYRPAGALSDSPTAMDIPRSLTALQVSAPPVPVASKTTGNDAVTASPSLLVEGTLPSQLSTAAGLSIGGGTAIGAATASPAPLVVATLPSQLSTAAGLSISGGTAIGLASASGTMESFAAAEETSPGFVLSTRPPFRPPVRSPFRPPPRPPF